MRIMPEAIRLFEEMEGPKCTWSPRDWDGEYWKHEECPGCRRWWDLHALLHRELKCRPWQFPCIEHLATVSGYPEGDEAWKAWKPDLAAQARWRALAKAAKEARRAQKSLSTA
jgi:hypothetical protein